MKRSVARADTPDPASLVTAEPLPARGASRINSMPWAPRPWNPGRRNVRERLATRAAGGLSCPRLRSSRSSDRPAIRFRSWSSISRADLSSMSGRIAVPYVRDTRVFTMRSGREFHTSSGPTV